MKIIKTLILFFILNTELIAADIKSLEYFGKSINEIQARFKYEEQFSKSKGTLTEAQFNKILAHTEKALSYSARVHDKDLDKLDPALFNKTLAKNYENLFRKGLRHSIFSMKNSDVASGLKGMRLMNEWGKYYRKIRKKIL